MGLVAPLGETLDAFWSNISAGKSGIDRVKRVDLTGGYDTLIGGECVTFEPEKYIDKREVKRMDRFAQFAVAAASSAC